jgi:ArsR family transcriptional regulator
VSRHLGILAGDGWVTARADGPHRPYRMADDLAPDAAALWALVRDELTRSDPWPEDAERAAAVLAETDRSRAFFSASAGRWDEVRTELYGQRADLLPVLGLLDPDSVVGDLGGGTGHTALALAPFVRRVVLVDRSREMLRAARRRLGGLANVELRAGELTALPVADGELDLAVLSLVLHFLDDPAAALGEASRALKPGGRLVIVDLREHDRDRYREEMGHRWQGFEPDQLRGWLEQAGLREAIVRPLPADPAAQGPLLLLATARKTERARSGARTSKRTT